MILAGDVGGTKVNLAYYEVTGQRLVSGLTATYPSREYPHLTDILRHFISKNQLAVEYVSLGIAGPVKRGRAHLTNLGWHVDSRALIQDLNLKFAWLLNDLEATAYGVSALEPHELFTLNPGEDEAAGNAAIIAAGTGLGEAGLFWDGHRYLPLACEGGHCDFAARSDLDIELLKYLREQFGKVSWERVLSGPGSVNLYKFLRDCGYYPEPEWLTEELRGGGDPARIISEAGLAKRCELCVQALDLFAHYYGSEASNLALKIMATGGVYVGGGIAPKILDKLKDGTFVRAFTSAGRMEYLLQAMPVRVILNDKTALLGAARLAAAQAGFIR